MKIPPPCRLLARALLTQLPAEMHHDTPHCCPIGILSVRQRATERALVYAALREDLTVHTLFHQVGVGVSNGTLLESTAIAHCSNGTTSSLCLLTDNSFDCVERSLCLERCCFRAAETTSAKPNFAHCADILMAGKVAPHVRECRQAGQFYLSGRPRQHNFIAHSLTRPTLFPLARRLHLGKRTD